MPPTRGLTEKQKAEFRRKQEEARMKDWHERCTLILTRLIRYRGTKQDELARAIHKSRGAVSARLNGHTPWSATELVAVANLLEADGQTRAALLGGQEKCRWEYLT